MNLPIRLSEDSKQPIYHQIENQVKAMIVSGYLPPGSLLPSIRALSNALSCSVITSRRAYQNLEYQGFIRTEQGKGTFVNPLDDHLIDRTRKSIINMAFEQAIEQGRQLGLTSQEMRTVFEHVISHDKDELE